MSAKTNIKVYFPEIGDRVRSFDFPNRRDCYIEGTLLDIAEVGGYKQYEIEVNKQYIEGKEVSFQYDRMYVPANGTRNQFGEEINQVEVI